MKHNLKREHGGRNELHWIEPKCSCGWRGIRKYAYEDTQYTDIAAQEAQHLAAARMEALASFGEQV